MMGYAAKHASLPACQNNADYDDTFNDKKWIANNDYIYLPTEQGPLLTRQASAEHINTQQLD